MPPLVVVKASVMSRTVRSFMADWAIDQEKCGGVWVSQKYHLKGSAGQQLFQQAQIQMRFNRIR